MNVIQLIVAELKAIVAKPHNIVVMLAVMCVPLLYAGMFLYGFWDAFGKTGNLPVAVVNQDAGADIAGKHLNAGSDLIKNLKKNNDFDWKFVSAEKAEDGFKNNRYFMIVRIPASFSKNATTLEDQQVKPANLVYRLNADYNFIASRMADAGVKQLKAKMAAEMTRTYAKTMYAQIDKLTDGLGDAAKGSTQLAGGSRKELDGLNQLKSGFKSLLSGTSQLTEGSGKLSAGTTQLNDGLKQAAAGTAQLYQQTSANSSNIAQLSNGADTLADKLDALNSGAEQLANGSVQLSAGTQTLEKNMAKYLSALDQFQQGMQKEKAGLDQLNAQLTEAKPQLEKIGSQMTQLANGINKVNDGTNQLASGIGRLADQQSGIPKLYDGTAELKTKVDALAKQLQQAQSQHPENLVKGLTDLTSGIEQMKAQVSDPDAAAALNKIEKNLSGDLPKLIESEQTHNKQMIDTVNADTNLTKEEKQALLDKITTIQSDEQKETAALIQDIGSNLQTLQTKMTAQTTALNSGLDQFLTGLNGTKTQTGLNAGVSQLVKGQEQLSANIIADGSKPTLQSGVSQLASSVAVLRNSVAGVPGQNGMNNGTPSLNLGAQQLKQGTNTLAEQVNASHSLGQVQQQLNQLTSGVAQLASGMNQLTAGQQALQENFVKLKAGQQRLTDGTQTLTANLAKVPNASKALSDGAAKIAAGNGRLNQTWPQLVNGIKTLHRGTDQLVSGSDKLAVNMNKLNSGITDLSGGQQKLAAGTDQLTSGAGQIYAGNKKLGSKLETAHGELQKTPTDSTHAKKFAEPVTSIDSSNQSVDTFGSGFAPYFISLGLYVGALLLTIIYDLGRPAGMATAGWSIAASKFFITLLMSLGQSLLVDIVVLKGLGLHVAHPWTFVGFTILTSMSYMALIQWLAGSFNNEGRFVAIVILIFQLVTSGGAYAIELIPKWLQSVSHVLPMTYSVNGFRNIIDGRQHALLVHNATILLLFVVAALILSIVTYTFKFRYTQNQLQSGDFEETPAE